jgi:hypothetical protein
MKELQGVVEAVACDSTHRFSKLRRAVIHLVTGHGIEGDAHAGPHVRHRFLARRNPRSPNLRQVHLIPAELFDDLASFGYQISPGDLGENITTRGLQIGAIATRDPLAARAVCRCRINGPANTMCSPDPFPSGPEEAADRRGAALQMRRHGHRAGRRALTPG